MTDTSFWDRLVEEFQSLGETVLEWIVLIAIALGLRARKGIILFALTTEYAKEKGWTTI